MKKTIKEKVVSLVKKAAPRPVGEVTIENEAKTAEQALAALSKEARKALNAVGCWHQDFHGNELAACMAMLMATNKAVKDKETALARAITFIGSLEHDRNYGDRALEVLEDINQLIIGESIKQSQDKHG